MALKAPLSGEFPRIEAENEPIVPSERFEDAYWPLYLRALAVAHRVLADRDAAEDVAADALARAHLHWGRIRALPYRDGWVLRVAANLAVDAARRMRRAVAPEHASVTFEDRAVERMALVRALRRLPKRQREAVALRFLAGLSHDEIAASLGIADATARVHLHRGLAALRATLGAEFPRGESR